MADIEDGYYVRIGADTSGFADGMRNASSALSGFADQVRSGIGEQMREFGSQLQNVGAQARDTGLVLSAAITAPLVGLATGALKAAGSMEQASVAFKTMLGSASAAADMMAKIRDFAASTPFEFTELVNAAKKMQALGFAAKDVIPMMRTLGDAVSALGGGAQMLDRVTLALGQMQAKGKVSAQEMNQLAEAGINAWAAVAVKIGKTIPEAMKLAEKGAIDSGTAIAAVMEDMNRKFAGGMAAQSQTLLGIWSNVKDAIGFTLADIGKALTPIAKDIMTNTFLPMLEKAKELAAAFSALSPETQKAAIGIAAFAAALGPALTALGLISSGLGTLTAFAGGIAGVFEEVGLSFASLGTAAASLGSILIVAAGAFAYWEGLKEIRRQIEDLMTPLSQISSLINSVFRDAFESAARWIGSFGDSFKGVGDVIRNLVGIVGPELARLGSAIRETFLGSLPYIGPIIQAFDQLKSILSNPWVKTATGQFQDMSKEVKSAAAASQAMASSQMQLQAANAVQAQTNTALIATIKTLKLSQEDAAKAAKKMAEETKAAFHDLGIKDVAADLAKAEQAFLKLYNAGKLSDQQIAAGLELIRQKTAAVIQSATDLNTLMADMYSMPMARLDRLIADQIRWLDPAPMRARQADLAAMNIELGAIQDETRRLAAIKLFDFTEARLDMAVMKQSVKDLGGALREDVLKSSEQLNLQWEGIVNAWDRGLISAHEYQVLQIKMLENELKLSIARGDSVTQINATRDALANARGELGKMEGTVKTVDKAWGEFKSTLAHSWDTFQDGISKAIISGKGFGETFVNLAKQIRDALVSYIVKEAFGALTKGLSGLKESFSDFLSSIGSKIGGIFGIGSGAAGGAGGSAGGATGGAGSAVGGLLGGALGIANLGVSIVSGIVSGVQQAHANNLLDLIEKNTRGLFNVTMDHFKLAQEMLPRLGEIRDFLVTSVEYFQMMTMNLEQLAQGGAGDQSHDLWVGMFNRVDTINATLVRGVSGIIDALRQVYDLVNQITNAILNDVRMAVWNLYAVTAKPGSTPAGGSGGGTNPLNRPNNQTNNITLNVMVPSGNPQQQAGQFTQALSYALGKY